MSVLYTKTYHFLYCMTSSPMALVKGVHTCNVTACRKAVTLQVTDTIWCYELNFHPVPHGAKVSCERYRLGFPFCYGSPSDVFAASSGRCLRVTLPVHICSGRNHIIPLMRRPNIDSTPNKPVTWAGNQIWYVTWSRVPSAPSDMVLRYVVKLHECTYLKIHGRISTACLFQPATEYGSCQEMSRKTQAYFAIQLPSSGTP